MFLALLLTVVSVAQHAMAHNHEHSHARHNHEEDGNGRPVEGRATGLRGLQSTFEQSSASNEFNQSRARCGTVSPPRTGFETEELIQQPELIFRSTVQVAVHWHSIQKDDGSAGASEGQVMESIKVLNAAYASTGFQFVLKALTPTKRTDFWSATLDSPAELEMKTLLGVRDCNILNIYSIGSDLLGWATFPQDCKNFQVYDGVVIDYTTVPGGANTGYNLGDVLVHEVRTRRSSVCSKRFTGSGLPLSVCLLRLVTGWPLVCTSCMNLETPLNKYLTTNLLCRVKVWAVSYL